MFKEINNCEICGVETGDDYLSDPRCNLHGFGVVLCTRCADRCDALDDAAFEKLADETTATIMGAAREIRLSHALDAFCVLALDSDLSDEQLTSCAASVIADCFYSAKPEDFVSALRAMPATVFAHRVKRGRASR